MRPKSFGTFEKRAPDWLVAKNGHIATAVSLRWGFCQLLTNLALVITELKFDVESPTKDKDKWLYNLLTFHVHKPAHWHDCHNKRNGTPVRHQRYGCVIPTKDHLWRSLYWSPGIPNKIIERSTDWKYNQNIPSSFVDLAFVLVNGTKRFIPPIVWTKQVCSLFERLFSLHTDTVPETPMKFVNITINCPLSTCLCWSISTVVC